MSPPESIHAKAGRGRAAEHRQHALPQPLSDIGGIFTPFDLALIVLMIGAPGLALGGLVGALARRRRRIVGGLAGAALGFAVWLIGWLWFTDAL